MTPNAWIQIILLCAVTLLLVKPLGAYMARVYEGQKIPGLGVVVGPVERAIYWLSGTSLDEEMNWKQYAMACIVFNLLGFVVVYILQRAQGYLPLNPAAMSANTPDNSFNTAASFITNTNWQSYGGETTMSYLTQMLALTVQNFVSAATGMAVMVALFRGIARKTTTGIGNFWVDLVRTTLYILLPLAFVMALCLASQGVVQTLSTYHTVPVLQPSSYQTTATVKGKTVTTNNPVTTQTLAVGPAASQVAIKQLGTNGGGFFNVNSAHPFENPTGLSNFLELLAIILIPAASCYTFGRMVGDTRQGWALLAAMFILFVLLVIPCVLLEQGGNPALHHLVSQAQTSTQSGGNMTGKEVRFGPVNSAIWSVATAGTSNGSVNSMIDSYTPLAGMIPMFELQLGEVVFGGVGSGLYGMLAFVIVAVFIAGLMVGRTPEYLGKKIEAFETKMASIIILVPSAFAHVATAIACVTKAGVAGVDNPGPHGFSEILYTFCSQAANNGSAFAGIGANTPFYNLLGGIVILFCRYWAIIPALAIAGSLAKKKLIPPGSGTLPTHTPLFVFLLISVIVIVGGLTFFPALALGPIVEHLLLYHV